MALPERNRKSINKYHREKMLSIAFRLSKVYEQDLIEVYQNIPNKRQWFVDCLRKYQQEH